MFRRITGTLLTLCCAFAADDNMPLSDRVVRHLSELVRFDTSNPPGSETKIADYLKQVTAQFGIPSESFGGDPKRLNFVARLRGSGKGRPLLLFGQSDTAAVDRAQWTSDPFSGDVKGGFVYGKGSRHSKALLAAELSVFVEIKRRAIPLQRDIIFCVEADGAGSSGMQWMIQNQWNKIDAEFAIGEGGSSFEADGRRVYLIQTAEKLPLRVQLTARPGNAGTRQEGPIVRLSRALIRISEAEPSIRLTPVTKRYFRELAKLAGNEWLLPVTARLENPGTAVAAAREVRSKNADLDALLHDTVLPISIRSGGRPSPAAAEAIVEVRRLPGESREEILGRIRASLVDVAVDVNVAPGPQVPVAEPSSLNTAAFRAMQNVFSKLHPEDIISPFVSLVPTGNVYLRSRGMSVYGLPLFAPDGGNGGNAPEEKIAIADLHDGVELIWQMVLEIAGGS